MSCIGGARQEQQPTGCTVSEETAMGSDEENIIRYMAGYIPFKLMKVYKKKDTQEDANVLVMCIEANNMLLCIVPD